MSWTTEFDGSTLTGYSDSDLYDPSDTYIHDLRVGFDIDLQTLSNGSEPFDIGIRQVATTVPIPSAVWLLGCGLIAFVGVRRKLRK